MGQMISTLSEVVFYLEFQVYFLTLISSSSKIVPVLKLSISDARDSVVSTDGGVETVLLS